MDNGYKFLMSVYNDIEAENVVGVLEIEGIGARWETPGRVELMNVYDESVKSVDVYVPDYDYEKARRVIEVEMVRGDF